LDDRASFVQRINITVTTIAHTGFLQNIFGTVRTFPLVSELEKPKAVMWADLIVVWEDLLANWTNLHMGVCNSTVGPITPRL
jgi:hypothetical protein